MTDEDCTRIANSEYAVIYNNYASIAQDLTNRRTQLITQLNNYGITNTEGLSFTELINQIKHIQTVETYSESNPKPLDDPKFTNFNISTHSYTEYNIALAKQINYYMRLLKYYLVLKGVDPETIAAADNLESRIELLNFIEIYETSNLTVDTNKEFRFLQQTNIPYSLTDINNNEITEGELTLIRVIDNREIIVKTINAGDELLITPKVSQTNNENIDNEELETQTYKLEYEGYAQYSPKTVTFTITILKGIPEVKINAFSSYDDTEYFSILLERDGETPQLDVTMTLTATLIDADKITTLNNDLPIIFTVNNEIIGRQQSINGVATITYTITSLEEIVVRAYTPTQVSNYLLIELISYFNQLKQLLSNVDYVYTELWENEDGIIVGKSKSTLNINNVSDLNGIIYDMKVTEDYWGYKVFNTDRNYITKEELNNLMTILIDYEDDGEDIIITTLGDNNE